jgi:K+-sensing histidine kinase KdpD
MWVEPHLPTPPPTGIVLLAVMITAVTRGAAAAALAATIGWLSYNFFLEAPRFVLQINSAWDVYVLCIFAAAGLFTGGLAERLQRERRQAKLRARQLEFLLRASQRFGTIVDLETLGEAAVELMIASGRGDPHLYLHPLQRSFTKAEHHPPEQLGQWLAESGTRESFAAEGWTARSLLAGQQQLGWAAWRTEAAGAAAEIDLKVLIDLLAATVVRIDQAQEPSSPPPS